AQLKKNGEVLEVGPGIGTLTAQLAEKVKKVVAIELDKNLLAELQKNLGNRNNVEIIQGDILKINRQALPLSKSYKIVANLPYNITSNFLRLFLSQEPKPSAMTLMLQKEVAQRVCAKPPQMSILSLSVQAYCYPTIKFYVDKKNFYPQPNVDSAVVALDQVSHTWNFKTPEQDFFRYLKIGFSAKRKYLANNLHNGTKIKIGLIKQIFNDLELSQRSRAQELYLEQWDKIGQKLNQHKAK
ncbi:MAG: ribosomal RNA small subunit methyltransferase A, partial [Candidatus Buchananbacteria bacterium CG10_big_fil_rev_8_21_14_0_10_42_9]